MRETDCILMRSNQTFTLIPLYLSVASYRFYKFGEILLRFLKRQIVLINVIVIVIFNVIIRSVSVIFTATAGSYEQGDGSSAYLTRFFNETRYLLALSYVNEEKLAVIGKKIRVLFKYIFRREIVIFRKNPLQLR